MSSLQRKGYGLACKSLQQALMYSEKSAEMSSAKVNGRRAHLRADHKNTSTQSRKKKKSSVGFLWA